jgi:hypothetical protein
MVCFETSGRFSLFAEFRAVLFLFRCYVFLGLDFMVWDFGFWGRIRSWNSHSSLVPSSKSIIGFFNHFWYTRVLKGGCRD